MRLRDYLGLLGLAGVILLIDQWTKVLVRANLELGQMWMPQGLEWLTPYARIVHWENRGAAFGLFQGGGMVFAVLAVVVIVLILFYLPRVPANEWALRLALSLQLGGASGNLVDRLTQDFTVTDMFSVGTFPVFNVADASISIGVAVLVVAVLYHEWREYRQSRAAQVPQALEASANPTPVDGESADAQSAVDVEPIRADGVAEPEDVLHGPERGSERGRELEREPEAQNPRG